MLKLFLSDSKSRFRFFFLSFGSVLIGANKCNRLNLKAALSHCYNWWFLRDDQVHQCLGTVVL